MKTRRKTRRDGAKTDQPVMMNYRLVAKEELGNGQRDISSLSSVAIEKWPLVKETTTGWSEEALVEEMAVYQCSNKRNSLKLKENQKRK